MHNVRSVWGIEGRMYLITNNSIENHLVLIFLRHRCYTNLGIPGTKYYWVWQLCFLFDKTHLEGKEKKKKKKIIIIISKRFPVTRKHDYHFHLLYHKMFTSMCGHTTINLGELWWWYLHCIHVHTQNVVLANLCFAILLNELFPWSALLNNVLQPEHIQSQETSNCIITTHQYFYFHCLSVTIFPSNIYLEMHPYFIIKNEKIWIETNKELLCGVNSLYLTCEIFRLF